MNSKTFTLRESDIDRRWYVVDATDQTLGRLASRIARVLKGKNKPEYTPNLDSGDHVIVLNAARVAVTRDKRETKLYIRHSGYPRGLKEETLGHLLERRPEEAIRRAVKGMLPRNRLGVRKIAVSYGESPARDGLVFVRRFVSIQQQIGGAPACGVRGHLPTEPVCRTRHLHQVGRRNCEHAAILRIVSQIHRGGFDKQILVDDGSQMRV